MDAIPFSDQNEYRFLPKYEGNTGKYDPTTDVRAMECSADKYFSNRIPGKLTSARNVWTQMRMLTGVQVHTACMSEPFAPVYASPFKLDIRKQVLISV